MQEHTGVLPHSQSEQHCRRIHRHALDVLRNEVFLECTDLSMHELVINSIPTMHTLEEEWATALEMRGERGFPFCAILIKWLKN